MTETTPERGTPTGRNDMTPERLAEIRQDVESLSGTQWQDRAIRDLLAENQQMREHEKRLRSFITPRHRYRLTIDADSIALHCTDHDDEIARWIAEPYYPFQPIDDAAHAHEVWQHPGELRFIKDAPPQGSFESAYQTPDFWCDRYGLEVRDPDGWRGKDDPSWETPITLPDFWRRFNRSTIRHLHLIDYDRIVADVKAAKSQENDD